MISTPDDIPCTIIPQSNLRCSIISAITLSEEDFVGRRRHASRGDYDTDDDDDIEAIEASIEQMVMDMNLRRSAVSALSAEESEGTDSDATHDRFGSFTGPPRTSELLQSIPKPERKPSVNIRLSVSGNYGNHDPHHRDSQIQDHAPHYDRMPHLPSRRPSESISRMQSYVSDQSEKSTLVGAGLQS